MKSHITQKPCFKREFHSGFTIIELLVSITIIGILTAIILPAVQQARGAARRVSCSNNLHQIGIAIHDFEAIHGILPHGAAGTPDGTSNFSFLVRILPQMEQEAIHARLMLSEGIESRQWARETLVSAYACPSDSETIQEPPRMMGANYAGNFGTGVQKFGYNGVFQHPAGTPERPEGPVRFRDITDGLSNTAMVSELLTSGGTNKRLRVLWSTNEYFGAPDQLEEFASTCAALANGTVNDRSGDGRGRPWIDGYVTVNFYNHILTPNQPSCLNKNFGQEAIFTATSEHTGGVNVLYADGNVRFTSDSISLAIWRAAGSRNGGE